MKRPPMQRIDPSLKRIVCAMLFAHVVSSIELSEVQLRRFAEIILPRLARIVNDSGPLYTNSLFGRQFFVVFEDPLAAARVALDIRDVFLNTNWIKDGFPHDLSIRLALHCGVIFFGKDPITKRNGLVGTQVNLTARIEPISQPGQVRATAPFVSLLDQCADATIGWDNLGPLVLAKKWGSALLFHVRRSTENPHPKSIQESAKAGSTRSPRVFSKAKV